MEKLTGKCELIEVESILITWLKVLFKKLFKESLNTSVTEL